MISMHSWLKKNPKNLSVYRKHSSRYNKHLSVYRKLWSKQNKRLSKQNKHSSKYNKHLSKHNKHWNKYNKHLSVCHKHFSKYKKHLSVCPKHFNICLAKCKKKSPKRVGKSSLLGFRLGYSFYIQILEAKKKPFTKHLLVKGWSRPSTK
jgi:septal ring factor EnvC (AmiA/AmiB activator)